jgi:hypothetical protein
MMRKVSLVIGACVVLLVLAKLLGLFSLFRPPTNAPPIPSTLQTTWTIKFHAANGSIQYDGVGFTPTKGQCKYATGTLNPKDLTVCQHDIVQWQATTPAGQNELVVSLSDKIFKDAANPANSVTVFVGNNGTPTTPQGLVESPDTNSHKWSAVVLDKKDSSNNANDDPKIKVGG